jgi:3-oxoacyl-[acyl-carrier-protein] synthase II
MDRRRVVVTGLGVISPVGNTVDEYWSSLVGGRSGIAPITQFDASELPVQFAGEVKGFDPEEFMDRRTARRMDRFDQLFYAATVQAMRDAGIDYVDDPEQGARAGAVVGSGIGGISSMEEGMDTLRTRGAERVSPYQVTRLIANMAAGDVSIGFGLLGPVTCTVTACAASANAIGDAAEIIRRGAADVMVAGGSEAPICEFGVASFAQARAVSTRNDDPQGACRPFDATRDGFVMAEGGGSLVLEELEHAKARGAHIYAEVLGYGMSSDAFHITLPRPGGDGAARAMQAALDDAGLDPSQIQYINAHGTSTPANDVTETAAIKTVFGDHARSLAISSTKSMTGHLLGGAGAVESIASILAMRHGVIPPTINYVHPDPECDLDYVPNEPRERDLHVVMSNSFGFGGHNAVLVYGTYD